MTDHCRCFKMPYVVCELLSDHDELLSVILNDSELLNYFFTFIFRIQDYKLSILCGYFSKVVKKMLELQPKQIIDYIFDNNYKIIKQMIELLQQYAICELIYQILNSIDSYFQSLRENTHEFSLKDNSNTESPELLQEETDLNNKRMYVCLYIFERIAHAYTDSMVLHAANIIINTVNKLDSKFGLELVEELYKEEYFEKLLRNVIPFKYELNTQTDEITEIKEFNVSCMKTSVSVVFNLVQIYISNKSRNENNDADSDNSKEDEEEKDKMTKELKNDFLNIIVKYIPFLVSILRQFQTVDEDYLSTLEDSYCRKYNSEAYRLNINVYKQFNSNKLELPTGTIQALGLERFRLVSFLGKIIYLNNPEINEELYSSKYLDTLVQMMWYFENNSIMHNTLTAIFKYILKNESSILLLWSLLVESNFVNQILDYALAEFEASKNGKNNYRTYLNAFSFNENLEDDQLKLPADISNQSTHDRKNSHDSDDMVKYDNDTRIDYSPDRNTVIQDFQTTTYVLRKKNQNAIYDTMQLYQDQGIINSKYHHNAYTESLYWNKVEHVSLDEEELNDLL
eukprot:Mrub_00724.p1 GENE.Mrub_00724~~Mrub_00724.p1  ORF type:complete len:569 (-),score=103.49 Mrub_00724:40-1746(-)